MQDFLTQHLIEIIFGLISAGALAFCRYFYVQLKNYKSLMNDKKEEHLEEIVDGRIEPILKEIEELRKYVRAQEALSKEQIELINSSYRYRLIQLCKEYLKQGYMIQEQCDQLTELYKVYEGLGGNGQVKDYYEKTMKLEIYPS